MTPAGHGSTALRSVERVTDELANLAHIAGRRSGALTALGVTFLALTAGIVTLVLASFGGAFGSYVQVSAQLPPVGASVALNSPVEYRDITVGKVATTPVASGSGVKVVLHLKPSMASSVPSNVTATVAPISIFGNQYVVLEPPSGSPEGELRQGEEIEVSGTQTDSVQTTLASLDQVLGELHPARLFASLSALADSLQGQGASLGKTFVSLDTYLAQMTPLWPEVVADLNLLAPVADQVENAVPAITSGIANFSVTSQTITSLQATLSQLLSGGTTFANLSTNLLQQIDQPYNQLVAASGPFLQDLSQTPDTISQILSGLDAWARTWVAAEANGPYLTLTATVAVQNVADLALVTLGGSNINALLSGAVGPSLVNPPTYTSANCPSYGTLIGEGCGATTAASVHPGAGLHGASLVAVAAQPAQQEAAGEVASGLAGHQVASTSVASLLLSPLLSRMVGS